MAKTTRLTPELLQDELARYEGRYKMPSLDFLDKYQSGQMGDSREVMRWAWLCSVALRLGMLTRSEAETRTSA